MRYALVLALSIGKPGDRWLGPDKVKHFFISAFVQSTSYAALRTAGAPHASSLWGASAVTATLGVGREVHDRHGTGFSVKDLTADAAGALAATALLAHTDHSDR